MKMLQLYSSGDGMTQVGGRFDNAMPPSHPEKIHQLEVAPLRALRNHMAQRGGGCPTCRAHSFYATDRWPL